MVLQVAAGDQIGVVKSSDCKPENSHIHFVVLKDGGPVDPSKFLLPRAPSRPEWIQKCDDYKLVWKVFIYTVLHMGLDVRKPIIRSLGTTNHRPACTSRQSDQHICYSFFEK